MQVLVVAYMRLHLHLHTARSPDPLIMCGENSMALPKPSETCDVFTCRIRSYRTEPGTCEASAIPLGDAMIIWAVCPTLGAVRGAGDRLNKPGQLPCPEFGQGDCHCSLLEPIKFLTFLVMDDSVLS